MYMNRTPCPISLSGYPGTGTRPKGMGLFDSMDFSTWGWEEWLVVGAGVYVLAKLSTQSYRASKKIYRAMGGDVY
jgi:hypothetical protein